MTEPTERVRISSFAAHFVKPVCIVLYGQFLLAGILLSIGCSRSFQPVALESIPGVYQGSGPGFREVITLKSNGNFQHEVFIDGKLFLDESGKWSYKGKGPIYVEPFTLFFDLESRRITHKGDEWAVAVLELSHEGRIPNRVSPSVGFEYCLYRRK